MIICHEVACLLKPAPVPRLFFSQTNDRSARVFASVDPQKAGKKKTVITTGMRRNDQYLFDLMTFLLFDQLTVAFRRLSFSRTTDTYISTMESRLESVKSILSHIDQSDVYVLLIAIPLLVLFALFRTWISAILAVMRWQYGYRPGYSGALSFPNGTSGILPNISAALE